MITKEDKILFLGAGGCGISNILQVFLEQGYNVVGVDKIRNAATFNLEKLGIKIFTEDEEVSVILNGVTKIIKSSAVKDDNKIIIESKLRNIDVLTRHDIFKQISNQKQVVAIAGSSGKTSTTGIIAHILNSHNDASYLIGIHGKGGHFGKSDDFVIEADEYAKTFLSLEKIKIGLITNIGFDHIDIYPTQNDYDKAFLQFAQTASKNKLVINGDNKKLVEITKHLDNVVSFGLGENCDFVAKNIINLEGGSSFSIFKEGVEIAKIKLQVIGGHNVINALAGFVVCVENGVPIEFIVNQLFTFKGMPRRLQLLKSAPFYVYDDYAHLPGEIETVLTGIAQSFPTRRVICYFQPHTYTRINSQFDLYPPALSLCDMLFLGDVYASRDSSGSVDLEKLLQSVTCPNKQLSGDIENSIKLIEKNVKPGDILICLNAGDGTKIAHYFAQI